MNKVFIIMLAAILASGCSKSGGMRFCEGVSPEGEGVNCGTEFESGDLTAIISSNKPFGKESLELEIYEIGENRKEKIESVSVKVKDADTAVHATIPFTNEGKYQVRAMIGDELVSQGDIKILD